MAMKDDLERAEAKIKDLIERNGRLEARLREEKDLVKQYEVAMSAVKWLWGRVQQALNLQL